jgi:hypothetical protein
VALARECFPFSEGKPFPGAAVYFRARDIWNTLEEEMGMRAVGRMRAACAENRELSEAPAQVFSEAEFPDARAFWTLPMNSFWIPLKTGTLKPGIGSSIEAKLLFPKS